MTPENSDNENYIHLVGSAAIHFNKDTNQLDVYAYDPEKRRIVRESVLPFQQEGGDDPWIILSDVHLVAEVPLQDLPKRLAAITTGAPHLKVIVQGKDSSVFDPVMTPQDPPVKTNQVPPL